MERIAEGQLEAAVGSVLAEVKGVAIAAVAHRVVHGGARFTGATLLDDEAIAAIEACVPLAPLHNPANLAAIRAARRALPDLPQIAVFDTAFHARMPRRATTYAIDPVLAEQHGIRRYGFHGTSHAYVADLAAKHLRRPLAQLRLVTLHLGNGASACAVELGHSTETSMGMTPLEGLVMGSRCGDLDPGVILALLAAGWDHARIDKCLNRESGLLGLSGVSNDLRDIERRASEGDDRCRLAITVFSHRVRKYVGAYAATMGGLDAVVLTGGIGENSATMRQRILQRFEFLGLVLDDDRNGAAKLTDEAPAALLTSDHSRTHALAVKTDEELSIARQTVQILEATRRARPLPAIPIAVSARHLHLT